MEGARFVSARENPRNLGFLPERGGSSGNKEIPAEMIPKTATPLLDRFRYLLKEREEELRVSEEDDNDDIPQLSMDDIVQCYEIVLSELIFNSKPIITELTMIAGDQKEYAEGIADAICARIVEAPIEQKLPSLYLLDSIVKNIGFEYIRYFALRLPEVFCEAYRQVPPNQYRALRHLFGTWSAVFPPSVLRKIGAELQFSSVVNHQSSASAALRSSESPSPRPAHGIHVNPKYLEARRQFENANMRVTDPNGGVARLTSFEEERMERNASTIPKGWSGASPKFDEIQDSRGILPSLQRYGQKPPFGHDEYDVDHADVICNRVGGRRLESPGIAARTSIGGAERLMSSKTKPLRPSSPLRDGSTESLSLSGDGIQTDNSPSREVERASPSQYGYEYAPDRVNRMDGERNDWTKHTSGINHQHNETANAYHLSNGSEQQRPRALIDAYGNYRGGSNLNEKPLKIERLDVNGINSEAAARRWQNTEEEEYVWEDMSPTLAYRSRSNGLAFKPPLGNVGTITGSGRSAIVSEPNFRLGSWPRQPQLPVMDDSAYIAGVGFSNLGSVRGAMGEPSVTGIGTRFGETPLRGSHYSQDPWNLQHSLPPSLRQHNVKGTSFPSMVLSTGQRMPSLMDNMEVLSSMAPMMLEKHLGQRPPSPSMAPHIWPPVHRSHPSLSFPILPQHKQIKGPFDNLDANKPLMNQGSSDSSILPRHHFDAVERKGLNSTTLLQLPHQPGGLSTLNNQSQGQVAPYMPPVPRSSEAQEDGFIPQIRGQVVPSHFSSQPFNRGHPLHGHGPSIIPYPLNKIPGIPSSVALPNVSNTPLQVQGSTLPPLPPGPPPASSQMGPLPQNIGPVASLPPAGTAFSGLISSLMAQGLISLTAPASVQDSVGVEFNADLLKVRHESAIKALYADLPRQCTTCGLRFKSQEEHSAHMDWHVTKNRTSRNRKQKPSRSWFVSTSVWLSSAEALGNDAAPGFLPTETVVEKKNDEEMAVPADENQNACALCGELFDDFYSDETEEWMYKGTVYLNAPDGSTGGMDRSQLGPIVHAKCRSESTVISPEDFGLDERGKTEDGSPRKRMRV